ncbi:hypothetical protein OG474_41705 [Kribbella sp. NBC_01505]|uniref:hypothetical protein n=1 Tax=Kribbella sp. NBC_01505 TaxID=2903580 RepID=UPI00386FDFBE
MARISRVAAAALMVAVLVPSAIAGTASATPPTDQKIETIGSEGTRTVPAYDEGRLVQVFEANFWASAGERRYISSNVLAKQGTGTSDPLLMAQTSIICAGTGSQQVGANMNVQRGQSITLNPRFVFISQNSGNVSCKLYAAGRRPDPTGSPASSNTWFVDYGSYLAVSAPMPSWTRTFDTSSLTSKRLDDPGDNWTPIDKTFTIASGVTQFDLISDHKVTVCSSSGGSEDSTTNGPLCTGDVVVPGGDSVVSLTVRVRQKTAGGAWCGGPQTLVDGKTYLVTREIHHRMLFSKGVVTVDPDCAPVFTVTANIKLESGVATVVHAPNETTLVTS